MIHSIGTGYEGLTFACRVEKRGNLSQHYFEIYNLLNSNKRIILVCHNNQFFIIDTEEEVTLFYLKYGAGKDKFDGIFRTADELTDHMPCIIPFINDYKEYLNVQQST